jgi:hypothetical protein
MFVADLRVAGVTGLELGWPELLKSQRLNCITAIIAKVETDRILFYIE